MFILEINKNLLQMILKTQSLWATCTLLCGYHCKHEHLKVDKPRVDINKILSQLELF